MSGRGPAFSKSVMVVSGLVVLIGAAVYPAIIYPRMNPGYYSKQLSLWCIRPYNLIMHVSTPSGEKQKSIRDKVPLEETQPGGMQTTLTVHACANIVHNLWSHILW